MFPDLAPALAGVDARGRAHRPASRGERRSRTCATRRRRSPGSAATHAAALVFGPETNGLTNDEIGLCGRAATIPADPAQPSYNLSHAVAIAAYEVRRAGRRGAARPRARATHDQKERLLELLEAGLRGHRRAAARPTGPRYFAEWRALVQRIDLTPKELRLLEHMARKMKRAAALMAEPAGAVRRRRRRSRAASRSPSSSGASCCSSARSCPTATASCATRRGRCRPSAQPRPVPRGRPLPGRAPAAGGCWCSRYDRTLWRPLRSAARRASCRDPSTTSRARTSTRTRSRSCTA